MTGWRLVTIQQAVPIGPAARAAQKKFDARQAAGLRKNLAEVKRQQQIARLEKRIKVEGAGLRRLRA